MEKVNTFDWFYQVGNITQENGKKVLKDIMIVGSPEEAERAIANGNRNCARRFRCDKKLGMIDEEWYDHKTGAWI